MLAPILLLALLTTAEPAQPPLLAAVENSDKPALLRLLSEGADVNQADATGMTALHLAALRNRPELARVLLEKGANASARTKEAVTPLHYACLWYETRVAALLLAAKVDVDPLDADGRTPLHWAAQRGQIETMKFLLGKGAAIGARDKLGRSPIHWAVLAGEKGPVEALIAKGAKIDAADENGDTPLHYAASAGRRFVIKSLLSKGANIKAKNHAGQTPLDVLDEPHRAALLEFLRAGDPPVASFATVWKQSLGDGFPFVCSSEACSWLAADENRIHAAGLILDRRTGRVIQDLRKKADDAEFEDVTIGGDVALLRFQVHYHGDLGPNERAPQTESTLLAVDTATGRSRWQAKGDIQSPVAIRGDRVFDVSGQVLWAVSAKTGKPIWRAEDDEYSSPVAGEKAVLANRSDGVRAFEAETGKVVWSLALPGRDSCPAASGTGAFFATRQVSERSQNEGEEAKVHLWALEEESGKLRWEKEFVGETSDTTPIVSGKKIFLVTGGQKRPGHIRALSAESGAVIWSREVVADDVTKDYRPTTSEKLLLAWTGSLEEFDRWSGSTNYSLLALDLETGATRWTYPLKDMEEKYTLSRPFFSKGLLIFSDGLHVFGRKMAGAPAGD